jgi:hypothetical protein
MSTELLASKIVILEEEPRVPAITAMPSAVLLILGLFERGPIADRNLVTGLEEAMNLHGGFTTWADAMVALHGFYTNGGVFAWISRTTHFTDLTDPSTTTATKGSKMLRTAGSSDTAAEVTCATPGPWDLRDFTGTPVNVLGIDIGAGAVASTFVGTKGSVTDTTVYPHAPLGAGVTVKFAFDGGSKQTVVFVGGETTAAAVAAVIAAQLVGGTAEVAAGQVKVSSDTLGTLSSVAVTDGTSPLTWAAPVHAPGDNVASLAAVTPAEAETIIELAMTPDVAVTVNGDDTITVATVAVGAAASIQVDVGTTSATQFGFDTDLHIGATAAPQDTLLVRGKTAGAYAGDITAVISAASNGVASRFNFQVLSSGLVKETFPNVTMDTTSVDYVETRVNHALRGSKLVEVVDQHLAVSVALRRPVNITSTALVGGSDGLVGLVDGDYIGNVAGPTGLYCFDVVEGGTILVVPGNTSAAVLTAMCDYAEVHRGGSMFCILDCPAGYTAAQMVAWVQSASLYERTEFAAVYWPRIKVVNPSTAIFGTDDYVTVPTSGWIAGLYAKNDQKLGGIYESPAGIGSGFGIIRGMVGVEDDPGGGAQHEVLDERKRDLVYPYRINPITKLSGTPWHIDGGRTLKSTSNFPNIGERRGVIFIEATVKSGLIVMKHRYNNADNRRKANRIITAFLLREMAKDAFRSKNPALAFYVDSSDQLNPVANEFAGIMTIRIGLATNKPGEFIVVIVTQDTRALLESLGV